LLLHSTGIEEITDICTANQSIKQLAMETNKTVITIEAMIEAPVQKVWDCWTKPEHIIHWNFASPDWHAPAAENDLQPGGKFVYRMEAKDGTVGFDFWGIYDAVKLHESIESTMGDGRKLRVDFIAVEDGTKVVESFEAEEENPVELQRTGWQAILHNFKKHTEEGS
jgi:uncharacterized protein YndB with AHSA1/START domain